MASGRCGRPALGELAHDGKPNGLLRFEEILFLDPALAITGRPVARLPHRAAMSCIQNKRRRISRGSRGEIRHYRATSNGLANSEAMSGAQSQHQRLSPISRQTGETGPLQPGRRNVKAIFNEMKGAYGQPRTRRELSARGIQTGKGTFIKFRTRSLRRRRARA